MTPIYLESNLEYVQAIVHSKRRQSKMWAVTKVKRNEPRKTKYAVVDSVFPLEDYTIHSSMARVVGHRRGLSAQHASKRKYQKLGRSAACLSDQVF